MEDSRKVRQLCDLPPEVFLVIASHMQSERDINSFSRCSRVLHGTLNRYLYTRNSRCKTGRNALLWAATHDKESTARLVLQQCKTKTLRRTKPLLLAAKYGSTAVVKLLLSMEGVDLEARTRTGRTPLALAVIKGHEEAIKLLLDAGANLDLRANRAKNNSKPADTLLCLAVRESPNIKPFRLLLATGKLDVNENSLNGDAPLPLALRRNDIEMVRLLLEAGADPNKLHRFRATPLTIAARVGSVDVVKLLLAHGANPGLIHNYAQAHPLIVAMRWRRLNVLEVLLEAEDVAINYMDMDCISPLIYAINAFNPTKNVLMLLARQDIDPNEGSLGREPTFPLYNAIMAERFEVASALMDHPRTDYYSRAMGLVAAVKTPAAARFLEPLYQSIAEDLYDINEDIESDRGTLLMQACAASNTAAVKLLVEKWGADPNYSPDHGWEAFPIDIAIANKLSRESGSSLRRAGWMLTRVRIGLLSAAGREWKALGSRDNQNSHTGVDRFNRGEAQRYGEAGTPWPLYWLTCK